MSLPAVWFRILFGAGWEISCFFPLHIGTLFRCCVLGQGTRPSKMIHLTQVKMRTDMAMCMISSMRRNGCTTVYMLSVELRCHTNEQLKWPGGKNVKIGWNTWYHSHQSYYSIVFTGHSQSRFNAHSIIRFDLGIIRRPDHCLDCLLSSFSHSCCWLSLLDVWWDQPISHSLLFASLQCYIAVSDRSSYEKMYTASLVRRDGLISALVTTLSPRLKARAWSGDLCWDEPISHSLYDSVCIIIWLSAKLYLDATNKSLWSIISTMYIQRFLRWSLLNQLWANVACFPANNAWYTYICEQLSHLNTH